MGNFITNIAWIIAVPSTIIFLAKLITEFKNSRKYSVFSIVFPIGYFLVPVICWAWILR